MYFPKPINTTNVQLPFQLSLVAEILAENAHEQWSLNRMKQGYRYGPQRNDSKKEHPCLIEYNSLTDSEKEYDRVMSRETLCVLVALNLPSPLDQLCPEIDVAELQEKLWPRRSPTIGYQPRPIDTTSIALSPQTEACIDKLAEHIHDVWAKARMMEGWIYGAERSDVAKTHPCLRPFHSLPRDDREINRSTARETIKVLSYICSIQTQKSAGAAKHRRNSQFSTTPSSSPSAISSPSSQYLSAKRSRICSADSPMTGNGSGLERALSPA